MIRVFIAIPTFETINPETFKSIYDLDLTGIWATFDFVKGYDCAKARNAIVKKALNSNVLPDYIFMVDSDIIVPKDALQNLTEDYPDAIFGVYPQKVKPSRSEIFDLQYDGYMPVARWNISELKQTPADRIQISGSGFGCALIKTKIFLEYPYPWFNYVSYDDGNFLSEDLYFCDKIKSRYIMLADTRVLCKHIGKRVVEC